MYLILIISKRENIRHLGKESVLLHFVSQMGHIYPLQWQRQDSFLKCLLPSPKVGALPWL